MSKKLAYLGKLAKVEAQLHNPDYLPWMDSLLKKYVQVYADDVRAQESLSSEPLDSK